MEINDTKKITELSEQTTISDDNFELISSVSGAAKRIPYSAMKNYIFPKVRTISLPMVNWTGTENVFSQVVSIDGVTSNSKVDLQPSPEQISDLVNNGTSLTTANDSGTVTVYAVGAKPTVDYTIQAIISEVIT